MQHQAVVGVGAQRGRRRASVIVKGMMGAAVLAGGGLGVYTVSRPAGEGERAGSATADITPVSSLSFDITTTATGDLRARKQIEIRSELDSESTIVELVEEGTFVKEGDLLVKLNGEQLQSQIDEESLRVESARAELIAAENAYEIQVSENESKLRQAQLKLDLAHLAMEQWEKGEVKQKKNDLELALRNSAKELERLRKKYQQSEDLNKLGFLSNNELDLDEIALRKAEADRAKAILDDETYHTYQHPKDLKSKSSDVTEARAELERVERQNTIQLASKEADRVNKRRQLQIREERLGKLQKQLEACTMLAPSAGLVVYGTSTMGDFVIYSQHGPIQIGRRVTPREVLIILPNTSEMVAQVRVHESLAGRIKQGQTAVVKIEAVGGQAFPGRVESIGLLPESGGWRDPNRREYTVKVAIDTQGADVSLRPSMRCEATITLGRVEDALALPIQAVFTDDAVRFVYVPRGSRYARVPVRVGRRSDIYAEIAAGLVEGRRVLVRQPAPGEVLDAPWDEAQLEVAGLKLGIDGKPVAIAAAPEVLAADGAPPEPPAEPETAEQPSLAEKPNSGEGREATGPKPASSGG